MTEPRPSRGTPPDQTDLPDDSHLDRGTFRLRNLQAFSVVTCPEDRTANRRRSMLYRVESEGSTTPLNIGVHKASEPSTGLVVVISAMTVLYGIGGFMTDCPSDLPKGNSNPQ